MSIITRLQHGWNAFMNKDPTGYGMKSDYGWGSSARPDRIRLTRGNERSTINAIYNRIALDVAAADIRHVKTDENRKYLEDMTSTLQDCLIVEANKDQTSRAFIVDAVVSMFDEGHVVLVPTYTNVDPRNNESFKVGAMRTGKVEKWFPDYVDVRLYDDVLGDFVVQRWPKRAVAIIENPLYSVINEPNSTFQRLVRKLNLLDAVDAQSSSGKLDLIIQLPYVIKTEARRAEAERRRLEIEKQLSGSKYGIAYTDGTERITQLNRAVENNLMSQIEYLTSMLYSQLGITQSVMDGTADEKTMLNYENRTIEPILLAITDEIRRKFLTKTARSQGQSIMYFRKPFRFATMTDIAEFSDKLTRNEILSSNEIRQELGFKPSADPKADELINSNISHPEGEETPPTEEHYDEDGTYE